MKHLFLLSISLFSLYSQPIFAEDKLSLPDTEVVVHTHDGNDLSLYQYPAKGNYLVLDSNQLQQKLYVLSKKSKGRR